MRTTNGVPAACRPVTGALKAMVAVGLLVAAAAFPAGVELTVRTGGGVLYGMAQELVYDASVTPVYTLSELDWAMQPLAFVSTSATVEAEFGLAVGLSLVYGVPAKSGAITDSDYANYDAAHTKTHFSSHDCYTDRAVFLDARVGWVFSLGSMVSLMPFGGFSLMELQWTARDGYLQYPPESATPYTAWTRDTPRIYVYGPGILYQQEYYCPSLGLEVRVRPLAGLEARASFAGFPFVACNDLDSHLLRQLDFYGTFRGGYIVEPSVAASYQLSERATLSLDVAYRRVAGLMGDVLEKGTGVKGMPSADPAAPGPGDSAGPYTDGAGAAISYVRASLSLALRY